MLILVMASITFFTLLLEIYERPYWTSDRKEPYLQFTTFQSTAWYTIITMTTVGYGDMCASTPVGRFVAIFTIMVGSWIMAIVIAVQASLFELGKEEQLSIRDVSRQRGAVKVIIAALRLQVARSRRYRYGENEGDYQPTGPEIEELRIKMIEEAQNWKFLRDLSS